MQVVLEVFYHNCALFDAEQCTHTVQQSKTYLDECALRTGDMKLEQNEDVMEKEESTCKKPANSIFGKSPSTHFFPVRQDQAECDFLSDDASGIKNHYFCPSVIYVLLKNYMGIFPLWSVLLLGNLSRHGKDKTPKTDSGVKNGIPTATWSSGLVWQKHSILQKYKSLQNLFQNFLVQNKEDMLST